jgi:hypothetical protein
LKVTRQINHGGLEKFSKLIGDFDKLSTSVGWFSSAQYSENGKTVPVATVAAQNEFGNQSKNIPPRPFIRSTINKKKNNWMKIASLESLKVLKGQTTANNVMEVIGQVSSGDIKETITKLQNPPLAESTRRSRRSKEKNGKITNENTLYKPLVETKTMLNTLTYIVEQKP